MKTATGHTLCPVTVRGNRIYAADGEEIAVATRASNKWRGSADDTARKIAVALNAHEAAEEVLRIFLDRDADCEHLEEDEPCLPCMAKRALCLMEPSPASGGKE